MERGHEFKVLDHGYVKLIDSMGSDETIVEAARMSTGRGFVSWEPYRRCQACDDITLFDEKKRQVMVGYLGMPFRAQCLAAETHDWQDFPRGDLGILEYLYKNRHTTPFEMCELIIDVQVPMDVWRQWIRHRTASVNECSTRYSEAINLMTATAPEAWRTQGVTNRQGSGAFLPAGVEADFHEPHFGTPTKDGVGLSQVEAWFHQQARAVYEQRLRSGVAKEQARKDLPLSTYTAARWKCDLKNVLHFLGLRMHSHAQWEIRQYANAVAEIVKAIWPRTYALFEEHDLNGVRLSATEARLLKRALIDSQLKAAATLEKVDDKQLAALCEKIGVGK